MDYLGRYKLVERIAIGGMAEIFLAEQPGPAGFSRRVAIKRILPHRADDAEFVEMFLNEARLSALLNHPNIVQIYDLGEADGQYYIAMEYVDGYDLGQLLDKCEERRDMMPAPFIAKIVAQAAAGLHYAHAYCDPQTGQPLNLIHRDISLPNIMLSKEGVVKLLDFGIAKAATTEQRAPTQTGVLKGKISYMSPEYLMGEPIDYRHDLFALGVVMFELATGQKPFEARGDVQMLQAILTQPPRDPLSLNGNLSRQFVDCAMRMLAKDPRERFQHGSDIQGALDQYIFDEAGGEITHGALSQFVQALFQGQPLPDPSRMARQNSPRPHAPPRSSSGLQPQKQRETSDVQAFRSSSSDSWMEETRALSLNTSSLAGLSAPQNDLGGGFSVSEQTAVLQIDSLEGTLDRHVSSIPSGPSSFDDDQPMTMELDSSIIPPPPEDAALAAPLAPMHPPVANAPTTDLSSMEPPISEAPPPVEAPPAPQGEPNQGIPKWLILVIPLCLLCGGLSVVAWKLITKDKPKEAADAGAVAQRTTKQPANRTTTVQQRVPPRGATKVARPNLRPPVPRKRGDGPPVPIFNGNGNSGNGKPPVPAFPRPRNPNVPPLPTNPGAAVAPPPNRRLQFGLYLKTFPRTYVYWQGQKRGLTPLELPLTPGTHHLILRRFRPHIRFPYQVTIQEGEYLQKTVVIREGLLDIRVSPWAQVTIDNHYIGRTPLSPIRLYAGYHRVRLVNTKLNKRSFRNVLITGGRKLRMRLKWK